MNQINLKNYVGCGVGAGVGAGVGGFGVGFGVGAGAFFYSKNSRKK